VANLIQVLRAAPVVRNAGLAFWGLVVLLRLYGFAEYSYTNDELSALYRTRYDGLADLLHQGVAPDGHPALVQVFLYYWTQAGAAVVGNAYNELWIRMPFVLMGLAALWLGYRFICRRFGAGAGLLYLALGAGLEYLQVFGIQARPYAVGALGVAWLLDATDRLLAAEPTPDRTQRRRALEIALAAALCLYSHYFAGLTALALGLWAIVLYIKHKRQQALHLLGAGLVGGLLYLPHLPLTLTQMEAGGLSWLAPPTWPYPWHYWLEAAGQSWGLALALLVLVGLATIQKDGLIRQRLWLLGSFFTVFGVGFVWSVTQAPVLHMGSLYFVYPLMLMLAATAVATWPPKRAIVCGVIALFISLFVGWGQGPLAAHPRYTRFDQLAWQIITWQQAIGPQLIYWIGSATQPWYFLNYPRRWHYDEPGDFQFFGLREPADAGRLARALNAAPQDYAALLWGNQYLAPEAVAVLSYYYPNVLEGQWQPYGGALLATRRDARNPSPVDANGITASDAEFMADARLPARPEGYAPGPAVVYAVVGVSPHSGSGEDGLLLVLELKGFGKTLYYTAQPRKAFPPLSPDADHTRLFAAHWVPPHMPPDAQWHAYLWNPNRATVTHAPIRLIYKALPTQAAQ